jgi:hypothetical protein
MNKQKLIKEVETAIEALHTKGYKDLGVVTTMADNLVVYQLGLKNEIIYLRITDTGNSIEAKTDSPDLKLNNEMIEDVNSIQAYLNRVFYHIL